MLKQYSGWQLRLLCSCFLFQKLSVRFWRCQRMIAGIRVSYTRITAIDLLTKKTRQHLPCVETLFKTPKYCSKFFFLLYPSRLASLWGVSYVYERLLLLQTLSAETGCLTSPLTNAAIGKLAKRLLDGTRNYALFWNHAERPIASQNLRKNKGKKVEGRGEGMARAFVGWLMDRGVSTV